MGKPILMDLIEAFLTIGFRSPYCQYEVMDSYSFNETRGEGLGKTSPCVRHAMRKFLKQKTYS